jgi:hypothetical protein
MLRILGISLALAMVLVLTLGTAAFAYGPCGPDFEIEWEGELDCATVGVAGSIVSAGGYTQFSSGGAEIEGRFTANDYDCGKITNMLCAEAEGSCAGPGFIAYETFAGTMCDDEIENGQLLSIYAAGSCEAEMFVASESKCNTLDTFYNMEADGCDFLVKALAATVNGCDAAMIDITAANTDGNGSAEVMGSVDENLWANADVWSTGAGLFTIQAAGDEFAKVDDIEVNGGFIKVIAGYACGIDADDICIVAK